jgi:D-aminopeptidase
VVSAESGGFTIGVLVQANHGRRERLAVNGAPVGEEIPVTEVPEPDEPDVPPGAGSIIVVAATDAPLLPHQCDRLAQRISLAIGRTGGVGEHSSGDIFVAFATGNRGPVPSYKEDGEGVTVPVTMLSDAFINPLFDAVIEATEEAIVNVLLTAPTMAGRDGVTAYGLDPQRLIQALATYGRHQPVD